MIKNIFWNYSLVIGGNGERRWGSHREQRFVVTILPIMKYDAAEIKIFPMAREALWLGDSEERKQRKGCMARLFITIRRI